MYVCVCNAVTERHIFEAARSGMTRLRQLRETLGVTADCGRCAKCAHQCLRDALTRPADADDQICIRSPHPGFSSLRSPHERRQEGDPVAEQAAHDGTHCHQPVLSARTHVQELGPGQAWQA
ncbi:(2Fe-2S)-binding protein [Thauera sinica]|uniref:Bacterioferritin-associated ferredoxin n=1 Tax=Thauera sinica TaxID=2665146 RepID=A0ABW1ARS7_9RHOO